jgi:hypothetical protein
MLRRLFSVAAVVVCLATPTLYAGFSRAQDFHPATPEELALKGAAGEPAVILDWVRFDDDVYSAGSEYYRIKILTDEGKKYADVEVPYIPTYPYQARVGEISARTIHPDGSIVPFDGKVYDKILYKAGRASLRAKTFTLADVRPGSIIEYRYQTHWSETLLPNTAWSLQKDVPVRHLKFTLKPYDTQGEFGSFFTYQGIPGGKAPAKTRDSFELELENVAAFQSESFAPPEEYLRARVNFYYTSSKVRLADFWKVEAATWSKKAEGFIGKSGAGGVAAKYASIQDPIEKLTKLYAEVQSMRNYSFETSKGDQEQAKEAITAAKNAEEIFRKRAGFRDELNRAFVALAREAGFNASAAHVPSRNEYFFSDKIPDAEQMNAEIAIVDVAGKTLYLDPGTPTAPFGLVSWEKTGVPAIQASKAGAVWTKVPEHTPAESVMRRVANLTLDAEDTLAGTVTVTFSGQDALVRRLRGLGDDEAARKKAVEDDVKGWFPDGATAKLTALTGLTAFNEPVVATFDVKLPNLVSRAGSRVVLPGSVFEAKSKNPFAPEKRVNPIYFAYARTKDDEVKITLPEGLKPAALPQPAELKGGAAFNYTSSVAASGNVLTFKRNFQIGVLLIDTKFYDAVRSLFSAIAAADQEPLVLTAAK